MPSDTAATKKSVTCLLLAPGEGDSYKLRDLLERHPSPIRDVEFITLATEVQYGGVVSDAALQIPRTIENADAIVADLTGADPNVMYEVGFAHGLKKPVFPIIRRGGGKIPSDLQGYLFYTYDDHAPSYFVLADQILHWLDRTFGDRLK